MKNPTILLVIMILFGVQFQSDAQEIADSRNEWYIAIHGFNPSDVRSFSYRIGADTLVEGTMYKEVLRRDDIVTNEWIVEDYIREDSLKRVYLGIGADEKLQYDFGLGIGDTFEIESGCSVEVVEIDSILISNGEMRKRIHLDRVEGPYESSFWIEGIGSPYGLAAPHANVHCYTDFGHNLTCFVHDGEVLYPETFSECWITPVQEIEKGKFVKVFPNPFDNSITISSDSGLNVSKASIYSFLGNKLQDIQIHSEDTEIETSSWPPGVYFVVLSTDTGVLFSRKIVK